jgi:hypothetical protein
MAFSALNNAQTAWYLANRPGGLPNGTPGTALVSDLAVNDFVIGARATVVSTGTTTSGVRTLTVSRAGMNFTVQWVAASTVLIIR